MSVRRDRAAATALVEENTPLARSAVRAWRRPSLDPDDLLQRCIVAAGHNTRFYNSAPIFEFNHARRFRARFFEQSA